MASSSASVDRVGLQVAELQDREIAHHALVGRSGVLEVRLDRRGVIGEGPGKAPEPPATLGAEAVCRGDYRLWPCSYLLADAGAAKRRIT